MSQELSLHRPSRTYALPRWVRVSMALLMFLVAGLNMVKHFFRYNWVIWLSFGLYYVIYSPKTAEESMGQYFRKPRTIASLCLLLVVMAGSIRDLYFLS